MRTGRTRMVTGTLAALASLAALVALSAPALATSRVAPSDPGNCNGRWGCPAVSKPPPPRCNSHGNCHHCKHDHNPYGCPPPSTEPHGHNGKALGHRGHAGSQVAVTLQGVKAGTPVRVMWGARQVASGVTRPGVRPASVGSAAVLNRGPSPAAGQAGPVSYFVYRAPALRPGTYDVVIAGPSFSDNLGSYTLTAAKGSSAASPSQVSSGNSAAYKGLEDAMWALVALCLLGAGYVLVRYGRTRRAHL